MDKKNKIVIIVLVVLAVLFFSGVAGNLVPKKKRSADTYDPGGWETTLGKWMAPFAPSLDVTTLLSESKKSGNCEYITEKNEDYEDYEVILLNKTTATCAINIPGFKDKKYKKGKLKLIKKNGTKIPNVTIQYLPNGKSEDDEDYKPVFFKDEEGNDDLEKSFVALKKGGDLIVKCEGCFDEVQERTIQVIFE